MSESIAKLIELELVFVERIWARVGSRLCIEVFVRRGDDEQAIFGEHSLGLSNECIPLPQVLDHLKADDYIEGRREEGQMRAGGAHPAQVWTAVLRRSIRYRILRDVQTHHELCAERKLICAVAGSTAGIQNAKVATESLGECVSRQVFVPEVLIDAAWNDSLAGKLDAHAT